MKKLIFGSSSALLAAVLLSTSPADAGMEPLADPIDLYGTDMLFRIYRDDAPVGEHEVVFSRDGDRLVVRTASKIDVKFLFITAYSFRYQSEAEWRNGKMLSLKAKTDDGGDITEVAARVDGDAVQIQGGNGALTAPAGIFPTNHWNPGVVATSQVLNTITGGVNDVTINRAAREVVQFGQGTRDAWRFEYGGDLQTNVFYDDAGRWLGMRFAAKDGSTLEYRCVKCAPAPVMAEAGTPVNAN